MVETVRSPPSMLCLNKTPLLISWTMLVAESRRPRFHHRTRELTRSVPTLTSFAVGRTTSAASTAVGAAILSIADADWSGVDGLFGYFYLVYFDRLRFWQSSWENLPQLPSGSLVPAAVAAKRKPTVPTPYRCTL